MTYRPWLRTARLGVRGNKKEEEEEEVRSHFGSRVWRPSAAASLGQNALSPPRLKVRPAQLVPFPRWRVCGWGAWGLPRSRVRSPSQDDGGAPTGIQVTTADTAERKGPGGIGEHTGRLRPRRAAAHIRKATTQPRCVPSVGFDPKRGASKTLAGWPLRQRSVFSLDLHGL